LVILNPDVVNEPNGVPTPQTPGRQAAEEALRSYCLGQAKNRNTYGLLAALGGIALAGTNLVIIYVGGRGDSEVRRAAR
jgi:hypothetical protein